jgi:hypothetical protein
MTAGKQRQEGEEWMFHCVQHDSREGRKAKNGCFTEFNMTAVKAGRRRMDTCFRRYDSNKTKAERKRQEGEEWMFHCVQHDSYEGRKAKNGYFTVYNMTAMKAGRQRKKDRKAKNGYLLSQV